MKIDNTFFKMREHTVLSLLGLVLSLSGTLIIIRYLHQEWSVDHWVPDRDRICVALMKDSTATMLLGNIVEDVDKNIHEHNAVEATAEIYMRSLLSVKMDDGETYTVCGICSDSDFVKIYPLKTADGVLSLKTIGDVIISESLAQRMFPDESAVGKTLYMDGEKLHTIRGVFRKPRGKSMLKYDMVSNINKNANYSNYGMFRLVKLIPAVSREQFNEQESNVEHVYKSYMGERTCHYYLETMDYLKKSFMLSQFPCVSANSSANYLWMLLAVGILLLFVGVFNFLNLQAVVLRKRSQEMQVRRIFGASKWDIFTQLYIEGLIISSLAMFGVWMIIELATPHMQEWFSIEQINMPVFDTVLSLGIMFIAPLLSPLGWMRRIWAGGSTPQGGKGGRTGGSVFLFLQYFISLTLITVSIYMMIQLRQMMKRDPGIKTESVLSCLPVTSDIEYNLTWDKVAASRQLFRQRMKECPYIHGYCEDPGIIKPAPNSLRSESGVKIDFIRINEQLIDVLGIEVLEGRTFCDSLDSQTQYHCLLSETALKSLGLKDWRTEGVTLAAHYLITQETDKTKLPHYEVVGIVRDIHPGRQSEPVPPMMFFYNRDKYTNDQIHMYMGSAEKRTLVSIEPGHEAEVLKFMKNIAKEVYGNNDMDYHWLSDEVRDLYKEDRRTARIFFTFAFLALGVTCLGVLGLMMFEIRGRRREIALRKVHGARLKDIALLLSRRYLIILGIAALISIPVSLVSLHKLVTRYYTIHASISWWIPIVSLLIVLLLSALTLWQQLWQAARTDPAEVMKGE